MAGKSINLLLLIFVQQILYALGTKPKILGSEICDYELHPYLVAIYSNTSYYVCGGTLISPEWVLTAGHCANRRMIARREITLRVGFYINRFVQIRYAIKGIPHHKYQYAHDIDVRYDISLLLADKPFQENTLPVPVKLPSVGFASKCKTITAVGIGEKKKLKWRERSTKKVNPKEPLYCEELPVISRDECARLSRQYVIDGSIICTIEKEADKDTCYGDSGGPIVCKGVVIGVIAVRSGCAQNNTAAFNTKIEHYLDFIAENINVGPAIGRSMNGTIKTVPKIIFLVIVFFLHYIMFNGFGYYQ